MVDRKEIPRLFLIPDQRNGVFREAREAFVRAESVRDLA